MARKWTAVPRLKNDHSPVAAGGLASSEVASKGLASMQQPMPPPPYSRPPLIPPPRAPTAPAFGQRAARIQQSWKTRLSRWVIAAWLLATGVRMVLRLARPRFGKRVQSKDRRVIVAAEQWYSSALSGIRGLFRATVVLAPATGCACEAPPLESFCRLARHWQARGIRFVIGDRSAATDSISNEAGGRIMTLPSAPQMPKGLNLLVFGRTGRLLFAGPLALDCAAGAEGAAAPTTLVNLLLDRVGEVENTASVPLLIHNTCRCAQ